MKRIFYSWQSDAPRKINHDFIGDCLRDAAANIEKHHGYALEVQEGVRGVPGSPALAETVLSRIAAVDIYVADISLVYEAEAKKGKDGKEVRRLAPNPNVALEFGYAISALSLFRVVSVQNMHFGGEEDQRPFDLKHLRWPLAYTLEPGASKAEISKSRGSLTKRLEDAILLILKDGRPLAALLAKRAEAASALANLVERNRAWELALKKHDIGTPDLAKKGLAITKRLDKLTSTLRSRLAHTSEIETLDRMLHAIAHGTLLTAGLPHGVESLSLDFADIKKMRGIIEKLAKAKGQLDKLEKEQAEIDAEMDGAAPTVPQ